MRSDNTITWESTLLIYINSALQIDYVVSLWLLMQLFKLKLTNTFNMKYLIQINHSNYF